MKSAAPHDSWEEPRAERKSTCTLCGSAGKILHEGVIDHGFGVPGNWSLRVCLNPGCGLVWQDPMVVQECLLQTYEHYYTKGEDKRRTGRPLRAARRLFLLLDRWNARLLNLDAERAEVGSAYLGTRAPGTLLDVGCGDGQFLAAMQRKGWRVRGTEFDPVSGKRTAEREGIPVDLGDLQNLKYPANSFDAITARHVIEHVRDALSMLQECWRLLKPGGRLVVITPNADSLGHKVYGRYWRGLEQPRHLYLYSPRSLLLMARKSAIHEAKIFTTAKAASYEFFASELARSSGVSLAMLVRLVSSIWYLNRKECAMVRKKGLDVGEELILIGDKAS